MGINYDIITQVTLTQSMMESTTMLTTDLIDHIDYILRSYMLIAVAAYFILPISRSIIVSVLNAVALRMYAAALAARGEENK